MAAGDGDFHEVVQHLVEQENFSLFLVGSLASISEELRPYATGFIELKDVAEDVSRPRFLSVHRPLAVVELYTKASRALDGRIERKSSTSRRSRQTQVTVGQASE